MDKRYFLILLIFIICIISLFLIAGNSEVVGSASVTIDNYIFSIPHNYNLLNSNENVVVIGDTKSDLVISISVIDKTSYSADFKLNEMKNSSYYTILSNGTIEIDNISINSIYYNFKENSNSSIVNGSIFYFEKFDSAFKIKMENFDYDNKNITVDNLAYIVDSLRIDYKH